MWIVLDAERDRLCEARPERLRGNAQRKIDTRRDAAAGDDIAIDHDTFSDRRCAERAEHLAAHPMRRGAPALQEPGRAEHQCAGAHARHIARTLRLATDEV